MAGPPVANAEFAVSIDQTNMFLVGGGRLALPPAEERRVVRIGDDEPEDLEISGGDAGVPSIASGNTAASSVTVLTPATVTILTPATEPSAFGIDIRGANFHTTVAIARINSRGCQSFHLDRKVAKLDTKDHRDSPYLFLPCPELHQ